MGKAKKMRAYSTRYGDSVGKKRIENPKALKNLVQNQVETAAAKKTLRPPKPMILLPYGNMDLGSMSKADVMNKIMNKAYRMQYFYKITTKDRKLKNFLANPAQIDYHKNKTKRNIICKSRQIGFCLDPLTKVLTADLRWMPIGELLPGQEIISVDEFPLKGRHHGRLMRTGKVEKVVFVKRDAYRITFDDGRSVICTAQHPWLCRKKSTDLNWGTIEFQRTESSHERRKVHLTVGAKVRWITKPWGESTIEDGWFSGMIDGEGSMSKPGAKPVKLCVSQRRGPVWDRMEEYVNMRGYNFTIESDAKNPIRKSKFGKNPVPKINIGRMNELFRLLGQTRPTRFVKNRFWEGRELPGKKTSIGLATIVKIEKLGEQKMVDLQTSCGTYIAEGFVSHNTTYSVIDMLDDVLFTRNYDALLISYDQPSALDIFDNKIMLAWRHFPLSHVYEVDTERQNRLKVGFMENPDGTSETYSSISVRTSGRSSTLSRVHISEFAKIATYEPRKAQEIISGTIPAVPLDGMIDIESTAESDSDYFADMFWDAWNRPADAPARPTDYKAHFYNWQWDGEEISKISLPDSQLPKEFREYQRKHNERAEKNVKLKSISDIEITYWFYKWIELHKSWNELFKNYPTTPEEAFQSSGSKMFDVAIIEKAQDAIASIAPIRTVGQWTYYKDPNPSHQYAIGADPSEGVGRDSSAAAIMDFSLPRPEIVGTYANDGIPPDLFAYELKSAGLYFGTALIAVERNNHGFATLTRLKDIYPIDQIYKQEKLDTEDEGGVAGSRLGWHTNFVTKPKMFFDFSTAFHDNQISILSKQILHEMRLYNKDDLQYIRAKDLGTRHYDLLTAAVICFQMRHLVEYSSDIVQVVSRSASSSNRFSVI